MPTCVVVGAQWGDEGKGKVVDLFAEECDFIVRYQGGNNAGHTLVVDRGNGPEKTVLHLLPSGILHPDKVCVIARGVVIDCDVLFRELDALAARGIGVAPAQLRIDLDAHIIMPYHRDIDLGREAASGDAKIGTTGRGIGPCYEDMIGRRGIRVRDLLEPARLIDRLQAVVPDRNATLRWLGRPEVTVEALAALLAPAAERLAPFAADCRSLVGDAWRAGKRVLFEGAQGTLLDVGHGTYPFVTSSYTTSAGVCVGVGVPPRAIEKVVGITKAYATRVGAGPFPTELFDEDGAQLRARGQEFGATTGRPRRCGWFDAAAVRYAHRLNDFTGLAITKLDVLSGFDEIKVCVAYDLDGQRLEVADADAVSLQRSVPIYETWPGWKQDLTAVRRLEDLPAAARAYLERLTELCGVPIDVVSVGPDRAQTLVLHQPF
jgi:adenylosuccinate synthase